MLIIGVDTGGTFTDFIYKDKSGVRVHKALSTPDNPSRAVIQGLGHIAQQTCVGNSLERVGASIAHGSTVATNAILERKGVRTALVTNAGFEDVIEIGRQNREDLYDLHYRRPEQVIPREMRFGAPGRVTSTGEIESDLTEAEAQKVVQAVADSGAQSVAVCLLFSFLRPEHENLLGRLFREKGIPVSLSHEILAEFREYERTTTTVVNAYVSPIMTRYLTDLNRWVQGNTFRVMQSNGGSISAETAMHESVRTILSGPAGGAVGALEIGRAAGMDRLITFDMGGTSTDVCLLNRGLPMTTQSAIAGYPVKVPMIDIHTVGAGGGSIAGLDRGGAMTVGPESAGAAPGPICYGRGGTRVTVTDANLYLGRIVPDFFLGGGMALAEDAARAELERMALDMDMSPEKLASGILDIANANMERAVRVISVERGFDPRDFTLFPFGGAGGMHCAELARSLGMTRILIPANPGILSAVGMLMADVVKDYSRTIMLPAREFSPQNAETVFREMELRGEDELASESVARESVRHERFLDMRYKGQSHELLVPFESDFHTAFGRLHEQRYGYADPGREMEVVNVRLASRGELSRPELPQLPDGKATPPANAKLGTRPAFLGGKWREATIMDRKALLSGNRFSGPAIVTEYSSTIVVPPEAECKVDKLGNLLMTLQ